MSEKNYVTIRISGELENKSPLILGGALYPEGNQIRGALGYIFLDMRSKISETYSGMVGHPGYTGAIIYYRDGLIKCLTGDGGDLIPLLRQNAIGGRVVKEVVYKCSKCGTINNINDRGSGGLGVGWTDNVIGINIGENRTNSFYNECVVNRPRAKFKFEVILKAAKNKDIEEHLSEIMAAIKFIEDNGLYLGKRKNKGFGKLTLSGVKYELIGMNDIEKRAEEIENKVKKDQGVMTIQLVSDTICRSPISAEELLKDVKNSAKFFHPHWNEVREGYKDPGLVLYGKSIEADLRDKKILHFLDCKVESGGGDDGGGEGGECKHETESLVVNRGTRFSYKFNNVDKVGSDFWQSLAMTELCRGIGDRTSFGKGTFMII